MTLHDSTDPVAEQTPRVRRIPAWVWVLIVALVLVILGAGAALLWNWNTQSDSDQAAGDSPAAGSQSTQEEQEGTTPQTVTGSESEGPTPGPSPGTAPPSISDQIAALPTTDQICSVIRTEIEATHGPGSWTFPPDRPVAYGTAFTCGYIPDAPMEFGPIEVVGLDDAGHYNYGIGNCCGDPQIRDYDPDLFCADVALDPWGDGFPGLRYNQALFYWYLNGRPSKMDVGNDGVPCTTVYSAAHVSGVWTIHVPPADPLVDQVTEVADLVPDLAAELQATYGAGTLWVDDAGIAPSGIGFTGYYSVPWVGNYTVSVTVTGANTFTWTAVAHP